MSDDPSISEATSSAMAAVATTASPSESPPSDSISKTQIAIESLSSILPTKIPPSILSSQNPAMSLLHHPSISSLISSLLRHPDSGSGDNNLCRWFYDTFQSTDPHLQLVVLSYLPAIAGLYLSRIFLRKPLAGFEAILLALYAQETTARAGQSITVNIPDLSHPSIYHESKESVKNNATELNLAVVSPCLEPHGTVRSTRRARIVGVALELYYSKISSMPVKSKIDFCEFCESWSGLDGEMYKEGGGGGGGGEDSGKEGGRIPLPWELLQPALRILGHCLMGPNNNKEKELFDAASKACRSLHVRALHEIDAKAMLGTRSLLRLMKMSSDPINDIDHTEIPITNVITL